MTATNETASAEPTIHGTCKPEFEAVKAAFRTNFTDHGDVGASVCVSLNDEVVVDLWAGARDGKTNEPWLEDTIVNVYSTTKTMAAACLLLLADRGELDFEERVAHYWPEFAAEGKADVRVKHLMAHSAGLSGMETPATAEQVYDWDFMVRALAAQAPWWEPGSQSGYHALTQGFLQGEVLRRITGQSLGTFFRKELAEPLGADFYIGTPLKHHARIGTLVPPKAPPASGAGDPDSIAARTFRNPAINARDSRTAAWREAEIPAANGHGNARSVVAVQALFANGGVSQGKRLLSEAGVERLFEEQISGRDLVLGVPLRFGMGYGLSSTVMPMGPNKRIAYWGGWGGSSIVIDADARLCVSYVMNRMEAGLMGDPRGFSLLQAAYETILI
ncbi:MAG: serine hydrolase domain-containing protein [Pseudomonadota bacterium]